LCQPILAASSNFNPLSTGPGEIYAFDTALSSLMRRFAAFVFDSLAG
jgi:hypothetical protein